MSDQQTTFCQCPSDWVLCLRRDCPRGARIAAAQEKARAVATAFLGDPRERVSLGPKDGKR